MFSFVYLIYCVYFVIDDCVLVVVKHTTISWYTAIVWDKDPDDYN